MIVHLLANGWARGGSKVDQKQADLQAHSLQTIAFAPQTHHPYYQSQACLAQSRLLVVHRANITNEEQL